MAEENAPTVPYLNPPARSILQNLPPELLHNIFECLHEEDVPAARATSTIMASVGLDHFGTEIPLVFHRQKFRALTEIAEHPVLSSRMTSLFYMCDRLGISNYRSWDNDRDWRSFQRAVIAEVGSAPSTASASVRAAFEQYLALCTDRIILEHGLVDFDCICQLFEGCRNLREITVACQDYCDRRLNASRTAFEHTMAEPSERFDWRDAGVGQVLSVVNAAFLAGLQIDSLTVIGTTHRLWDRCSAEETSHLHALVRPLRRLRIHIQAPIQDEDDYQAIEVFAEEHAESLHAGAFGRMIAEATQLRVLKLRFPKFPRYAVPDTYRLTYMPEVLGSAQFPHLYEFAIRQSSTTSHYLKAFIFNHKATLRRLVLSDISLVAPSDSWQQLFEAIAGQLPHLRQIKLRGDFRSEGSLSFNLGRPGSSHPEVSSFRDDIENFVLKGSEAPDWQRSYYLEEPFLSEERPGYKRPGLPMDNTAPDDPILDYESDEFDYMM